MSPVTFVDTSMSQIEKYMVILKDMNEPIYIPGDGIGTASYVCKMLGKNIFLLSLGLLEKREFTVV
jgi:hypothetical protein